MLELGKYDHMKSLNLNPNCTGLVCTMIILGGGLGGPPSDAAKFGMHLRNCAKRKILVLFFSKTAILLV